MHACINVRGSQEGKSEVEPAKIMEPKLQRGLDGGSGKYRARISKRGKTYQIVDLVEIQALEEVLSSRGGVKETNVEGATISISCMIAHKCEAFVCKAASF